MPSNLRQQRIWKKSCSETLYKTIATSAYNWNFGTETVQWESTLSYPASLLWQMEHNAHQGVFESAGHGRPLIKWQEVSRRKTRRALFNLKLVITAAHHHKPTALYIVRELPSKSCAKVCVSKWWGRSKLNGPALLAHSMEPELELHAATSQLEVITWVLFWTGLDPKVLVVCTLV